MRLLAFFTCSGADVAPDWGEGFGGSSDDTEMLNQLGSLMKDKDKADVVNNRANLDQVIG